MGPLPVSNELIERFVSQTAKTFIRAKKSGNDSSHRQPKHSFGRRNRILTCPSSDSTDVLSCLTFASSSATSLMSCSLSNIKLMLSDLRLWFSSDKLHAWWQDAPVKTKHVRTQKHTHASLKSTTGVSGRRAQRQMEQHTNSTVVFRGRVRVNAT